MFNFTPASKDSRHIFGAARPGFGTKTVTQQLLDEWISFMKQQNIENVCCLLSESQLAFYDDLLNVYYAAFGEDRVCWAPIEDFHLADEEMLVHRILPFLENATRANERVVVHCSAGLGRTGHVLAAWLVCGRDKANEAALREVERMGRRPYEALGRNAEGKRRLHKLLDACRRHSKILNA